MKYFNLSQCTGPRMVYFRSTDVEQKNYHRLLWSVPDEWLYLLMTGQEIEVIDQSSNRGKIEHIFIPVLNDVINYMSGAAEPKARHLKACFLLALDALNRDSSLNKKFEFWTKRIKHAVAIRAKTVHVDRELNPLEMAS